jgi:3-phenylpropionate/cinnamic acid dioxygenase small subunit
MMERDPAVADMLDRQAITDVLYRYASSIDHKDYDTLRSVLADDARAKYGDRDWLESGDAIVEFNREYGKVQAWQHHLLSVYHIDIAGDTASTMTYHTSHQTSPDDPTTVRVIIARYYDQLRREHGGWKIASKEMRVGWRETRHGEASGG